MLKKGKHMHESRKNVYEWKHSRRKQKILHKRVGVIDKYNKMILIF